MEDQEMKAITKKLLIILTVLAVMTTVVYAGKCTRKHIANQNTYNQEVFDQISLGYNDIPLY